MGEESKIPNPKEILAAINRVASEKDSRGIAMAIPPKPQTTRPEPKPEPMPESVAQSAAVEFEDHSNNQDGTVFLLWFDNEDAQRYPPGQQSGVYPMKSAFYLSKHVDFHNEKEKQDALQQIAGVVELFENDSPEVRGRGKYAIIIGKMVQVEVQKKIVLK